MTVAPVIGLRLVDHVENVLDREGGRVQCIRIGQAARTGRLTVVEVARGLWLMLMMMLQHCSISVSVFLSLCLTLAQFKSLESLTRGHFKLK